MRDRGHDRGPSSPRRGRGRRYRQIHRRQGGEKGKITIDLPEIAENGNTVPLSITVDSPMTADSYVTDMLVVADGNPRPGVATFHFTPLSGRAEAATRIRLAATQNIIVVAKTSDGKFYHRPQAGEGHHRRLRRLIRDRTTNEQSSGERHGRKAAPQSCPRKPRRARSSQIKTLLSHVMETGLRKDASRQRHPAQDHQQVHAARSTASRCSQLDLEPAIAANPYLQFTAKVDESGTFKFTWTDDDGTVTTAEEKITVA